ncbi:FUSC family protein, partial [Klebsiella pneumoniae]
PRSIFESRMFDRINALFMRLDPMVESQRAHLQASLAGLRIGLNVLVLRSLRPALAPPVAASVQGALAALATYFAGMARSRSPEMPLAILVSARQQVLADGDGVVST